ncbi:hypothetical protein CWI75_14770 [Kineobactrum sediminis]|uniref:AMIN domain-containing protein n=1 Tax=Kineobactrum sediminis TaxID=1905677 RepID=A0A2N5XZC4_9GAMM|nr:AMIN domain-containing protein [Kineobactrum sediminis]PLW81498.1 hypothetical protein CWI75_14770 [Kineobactrum sediminis]
MTLPRALTVGHVLRSASAALVVVLAGAVGVFPASGADGDATQGANGVAVGAVSPVPASATIRVGRDPGRTRMVLDLSAVPEYRIFSLTNPDRIVIDLANTRLSGGVPAGLFAATPVAGLRSAARDGNNLRLVLDLENPDLRREDFVLRPDANGGHRLVVDLYEGVEVVVEESAVEESLVEENAVEGSVVEKGAVEDSVVEDSVEPGDGRVAAVQSDAVMVEAGEADTKPDDAAATGPGLSAPVSPARPAPRVTDLRVSGYGELAGAYTVADPSHWSKLRARLELGVTGELDWGGRFKLMTRSEGDAAYSVEDDFYPSAVRNDQRSDFSIREAYLDFSAADWEYRLGRQHVVWGEMVGLFLADVVSAQDTREFFLPEFETMRIPQWAVRAERFIGDSHIDLLWVAYPSYNEIGEPGSDFYPFPIPADATMRDLTPDLVPDHITPSRGKLSNHGFGARYSRLVGGWDLTGFYYQSTDVAPTLYRTATGLELRHDRIRQLGTTFSKGYLDFVLKGEAVHTFGRKFLSADPAARFGLEESDALDYVLGVMIPRGDWRLDLQFYGRHVFDHSPALGFDADEVGITVLLNRRFTDRLEAELLYLSGLNRSDWSFQPSLTWNVTQSWRLQVGADWFGGSEIGLFGQYDDSDRVYLELRRWF